MSNSERNYNFEELRKEGKEQLKIWHNKRTLPVKDYDRLIPTSDNNFKLDFLEIEEYFPEIVMAMKNSPQSEKYHNEGDVWTHTKMVMEEMFNSQAYQSYPLWEQNVLFWSALLHDVSKPITVDFNVDKQQITNEQHSVLGASDARLFMWKTGFSPKLRETVARIIRYHQRPFHWHKKMSAFDLHKWSQDVPLDLLLTMARADTRGRRFKENNDLNIKNALDNLLLLEIMAEDHDCLTKPWDHDFENITARKIYFDGNGTSYVDRPVFEEEGSDVIFLSGLPASGKNYWVEKFGEGKPVLSYDDATEMLGLKHKNNGRSVQYVKEEAKKLLARKEPFIFNATHINENLRGKNLSLLKAYGAKIRIVHLEQDYKTLISRNSERKDNIPEKVISKMARNWSPPSSLESHELMWWDQKKGIPVYHDYLTSKKDPLSGWKFSE